jgi:hypothetical protein
VKLFYVSGDWKHDDFSADFGDDGTVTHTFNSQIKKAPDDGSSDAVKKPEIFRGMNSVHS